MRPAFFHPKALAFLRSLPRPARKAVGEAILALQDGAVLGMPLSRPMPAIAPGANELRIRDPDGAYRVLYTARSLRGILIFHAFNKKSQQTPIHQIDIGRKRLSEMLP